MNRWKNGGCIGFFSQGICQNTERKIRTGGGEKRKNECSYSNMFCLFHRRSSLQDQSSLQQTPDSAGLSQVCLLHSRTLFFFVCVCLYIYLSLYYSFAGQMSTLPGLIGPYSLSLNFSIYQPILNAGCFVPPFALPPSIFVFFSVKCFSA